MCSNKTHMNSKVVFLHNLSDDYYQKKKTIPEITEIITGKANLQPTRTCRDYSHKLFYLHKNQKNIIKE